MTPLVLALALAQPAPAPKTTEPKCRVLAKGDGYVVHAVATGARAPGATADGGPFGGRYAIVHTDLTSGAMKKLVEGGERMRIEPATSAVPPPPRTLTIAGAAAGPDRLYVLVVRGTALAAARPGAPIDLSRVPVEHVLYVFRLAHGSTAQEVALPGPPAAFAGFEPDTIEPDRIRVTPATVTVGTAVYRVGERLEQVAPPEPADPGDADSRTLAKGDGYVVTAVRAGPKTPGLPVVNPRSRRGFSGPRYSILHTDTKSGRVKKLVEGGEWAVPLQPMAIDRSTEHTVSIAAAATGPDRLYVLVVRSSAVVPPGPGGPRTVQHVLCVFRLADGSTVQEVVLPEPRERLGGFNQDDLDPGLIRVTPTTVTVGTAAYRVGERLEPVEPKP